MTNEDFIKYIFEWIYDEGSMDICSKCANCPKTDICTNIGANDITPCINGVKRYAEEHCANKE